MTEKYTVKEAWTKACKYDKVDPNSKFVVFSPKNPWAKKYNTAMKLQGMAKKVGYWGKKKTTCAKKKVARKR
jgi:hypothetical protein